MAGRPKGIPKTGGRVKGTPNKATATAREAISLFVEGNIERLQEWLDKIAEDDPNRAFEAFMKVVEYHIPKLSRAEHSGLDGGPIEYTERRVAFVEPTLETRTSDPLVDSDDRGANGTRH